jgi:hypothetical protein
MVDKSQEVHACSSGIKQVSAGRIGLSSRLLGLFLEDGRLERPPILEGEARIG